MAVAGAALLAACTLGPDYRRPEMAAPPAFKEAAYQGQGGWQPSIPADAMDRGPWWSVYDDPVLDGLERQVEINNQNLKASEAAYRQASATVRVARAGLFPTLDASGFIERQGTGGNGRSSRGGSTVARSSTVTQYNLGSTLSWDFDLWGKIRRTVESDSATAQATAGDLASARLSAQSTLATSYFELRIADELKRLLDTAATYYAQSLQITRNQYASGVASRSDVVQAETQLKTTQAQAINVGVQRAQLEHAIAVLIGKAPAELTIEPVQLTMTVPQIPAGVPAALLQRRPDIAAAERRVAAANAQIGVAEAGYYPDLTLNGSISWANTTPAGLLSSANRAWSLGPTLAQTIFNGGLTGAQVDQARAAWDESAANYRETTLTAFQQVEDQLAALRILEAQAAVQAEAVASAQEAERLLLNQYRAGVVAYTSVITAQTAALSNEQTALTILQNRLTASVALIQALGGGWDASQLPTLANAGNPGAAPLQPSDPQVTRASAEGSPSVLDRIGSFLQRPWW